MIFKGQNAEYVEIKEYKAGEYIHFDQDLIYPLTFVWIKGQNAEITFDGVSYSLENNTILSLSAFHKVEFTRLDSARFIKFNKEFYCVLNHDSEVSCKGILFFSSHQMPFFKIPEEEVEKFELFWKTFELEMRSKDELQLEMLQMMLKRFIILCTRIYKSQTKLDTLKDQEVNLVRDFHFLVEQHFKTKHSVGDYADLLFKSPKTLSNLFSKVSDKSPLQIIHERKTLEAKRLLRYTDMPIKEIAYELGFEDLQTFSRFFKKVEKISPSDFKNIQMGNIANS